jgi:hypothetical protein
MRTFLRRLRGAVVVGLTWSVLWIAIGLAIFGVISLADPGQIEPGEGLRTALPILGTVGFLSGLGFSALLSIIERRRSLEKLSLPRVALWGALGSAAIPLIMRGADGVWPETAVLGAICAAGTLAIARRHSTSTSVSA